MQIDHRTVTVAPEESILNAAMGCEMRLVEAMLADAFDAAAKYRRDLAEQVAQMQALKDTGTVLSDAGEKLLAELPPTHMSRRTARAFMLGMCS